MWWGSQTRHDRTLRVLDMFTEKTGIEFEPEFYGFDDYISKLNILIAANDPPDLMQLGGNFPTYIDHIEFLNPYIENGIIDVSNTDPSFIAITTLDGNTWASPRAPTPPPSRTIPSFLPRQACPSPPLTGPGRSLKRRR